jgi:hypothetical protein
VQGLGVGIGIEISTVLTGEILCFNSEKIQAGLTQGEENMQKRHPEIISGPRIISLFVLT